MISVAKGISAMAGSIIERFKNKNKEKIRQDKTRQDKTSTSLTLDLDVNIQFKKVAFIC